MEGSRSARSDRFWFLGSLGLALVFLVVYLLATGTFSWVGDPYKLKAYVPNGGQLVKNAGVRIAGLEVGKVTALERTGKMTRVDMEIDEEYTPIAPDTRVEVRLRSLIGENYVELYPGTSDKEPLASGGELPPSQAVEVVDVDQILAEFDPRTRKLARDTMQSLGAGVGDRGGELNRTLEGASDLVGAAEPVADVLARDRTQVARLVDQFGAVSQALGDRREDVRTLFGQARVTLDRVARRDDALRAVIDELPPTLQQVRGTVGVLRETTRTSAPVLSSVAGALRALDSPVDRLRPAALEGQQVVRQLGAAAPPLTRTLAELQRTAPAATKILPPLRRALCETNPPLKYLNGRAQELTAVLQGLGSATNYYDKTGNAGRLLLLFSEDSLAAQDATAAKAVDDLLKAGLIGKSFQKGYNFYREPFGAAEEGPDRAGTGAVGPADAPKTFQRIEAEC